jgi:hypothetical protein
MSDPITSVIAALRFDHPNPALLLAIPETRWAALLHATDRAQLTLPLGIRGRDAVPAGALARIDQSLAQNNIRYDRLKPYYNAIADAFEAAGIEFVVLKGLAQWPWYSDRMRDRAQSDIDLYCESDSLDAALRALTQLGYEPVHRAASSRTDHLPVMIRKTGWTWRGDHYDPDMPPSVELHFRLWDAKTEGFEVEALDAFWKRRVVREIGGLRIPTLHPVDGLTYSAMHVVRHLLRGDLQIRHVYELAHFMERSAGEDSFWRHWRESSTPQRRLVEGIAFRFAQEWFGPKLHPAALDCLATLPAPVSRWFSLFSLSPATAAARPNKDELWLHLALVSGGNIRRAIAIRRLLPTRGTRVVLNAHVGLHRTGPVLLIRRKLFAIGFNMRRVAYHARTLIPVIRSGLRWWRAGLA